MSTLVAYYSWSNGNTREVAERVASELSAELLEIETEALYEGSYDDVVELGKREVERGFEPELAPLAVEPLDYDRIIVGTPTWWYTMAPAVRTLLCSRDWSGKDMAFFQTHAGWPGDALEDMEGLVPGARVQPGLDVKFDSGGGDVLETSEEIVDAWACGLFQGK